MSLRENIVAASPVNLGVMSGHSGIINAEKVIRLAADFERNRFDFDAGAVTVGIDHDH